MTFSTASLGTEMDIPKLFAASILWYPLFLIPSALGFAAYYWMIKGSAKLTKANWATIIAPWIIWLLLMSFFSTGKKSLSNLVEPIILGAVVSVFFLVLGLLQKYTNLSQKVGSQVVLVSSCAVAFLLFFLVPGLPE
jgi:hypothetical protein